MRRKKIFIVSVASVILLALIVGCLYLFLEYLPEKKKTEERLQLVKDYYDSKISLYEEENKLYEPFEVDVAFIGDSLTDGYDVEAYYPEYKVENRGIGGDTTFGLFDRLDVSVYQLQPKVIVMLIGANNFKTMLDNYEDLIVGIKTNLTNTELVVCSLTSMGKEWGRNNHIAAYNNVYVKALAQKHGCVFVDLYTPLLNFETGEIYEHYTTDGGHLTHEGYVVLTSAIKPAIDSILNEK
jgi:lysophospholipase L1-like esterase